jgi:hypothetical protein
VDLWTTQRGVAHKLHKANNSKQKRTFDVLQKPDNLKSYRHRLRVDKTRRRPTGRILPINDSNQPVRS